MIKYQIGDLVDTFLGQSKILDIYPYTGNYPQWYDCVLKVEAPRTRRGWIEIASKGGKNEL